MGGTLAGKFPSTVYKDLLKLDTAVDNDGLTGSIVNICDGLGNNTPLKVSTSTVRIDNLEFTGNSIASTDVNGDIILAPNGVGLVEVPSGYDMSTGPDEAFATKDYVDTLPKYYLLAGALNGRTTENQRIFSNVAFINFTLPQNLTGSYAKARIGATLQTDFDIQVNGISKGTLRFAIAATSGTFIFGVAVDIVAGDLIEIIGPATPDLTLYDLTWTLLGSTA